MSKTIDDVIARIRKLLAMSKSDNEHEAALAADKARKLMEEHALTEAVLRTEDATREADAMIDEVRLDPDAPHGKARSAWRSRIAQAVASSFGCHSYTMGSETVVFGRESATQAWRYTTMYLVAEVNRLCESEWLKPGAHAYENPKAWRNAFRMGAASTIAKRLRHAREESAHEREIKQAAAAPTAETTALAVIVKDQAEVDAAYEALSGDFSRERPLGVVSSGDGFRRGRAAGERVEIGAQRAGLAPGRGSLKS